MDKLSGARGNMKKVWNTVNELTGRSKVAEKFESIRDGNAMDVHKAIFSLQPNSSSGFDGVDCSILRRVIPQTLDVDSPAQSLIY
uniref:Uncharacterized protein n=1 Tax=Phlebotomus papatasi TaxID=29031 RepID=A0A1B0DDZ4_PHLPP